MKPEKAEKEERCLCPYCEEELVITYAPFCQACGIVFRRCLECEITVLDKEATHCPKCGKLLT